MAENDPQKLAKKMSDLLKASGCEPTVGIDAVYMLAAQVTVAANMDPDNMIQRFGYWYWKRMMGKHRTNETVVARGEVEELRKQVRSLRAMLSGQITLGGEKDE